MEYNVRRYREHFREDRWRGFVVKQKESDLWIGVDKSSFRPEMPAFCDSVIIALRKEMEAYLAKDPGYAEALVPYNAGKEAPEIFRQMSAVAQKSRIGPMSAVAGAVSFHVAQALKQQFPIREAVVENGGDIYADIREEMDVAVFAGASPLSEKVGLHIPASGTPLGICTSSGTVGPSLSFGLADAVMIVCKDVLLADSYATAFANFVRTPEDIQPVLERIKNTEEILGAILIKDDKMGVVGQFELKFFNPQ
ncbi:MAG: UPF0280 family protein [Culturomica sp.]|jgi:ApbE superfamily uncharacterized protein (UPF0280 family)|nr:UPF0280 family protein [Culturomica sp.]